MQCIICKKDLPPEDFNDEHVFPKSIGGEFKLKEHVCKTCNSGLGTKVDLLLVDHVVIKLNRHINKIPNYSNVVPNAFGDGVDAKDPNIRVSWPSDRNGNMGEVHSHPYILSEKRSDGSVEVSGIFDEKDVDNAPEMFQKRLQRSGKHVSIEEIKQNMKTSYSSTNQQIIYNREVGVLDHKPCMAKIAYEMAFYWLGSQYLTDERGEKLRSCLFDLKEGMSIDESFSKNDMRGSADFIKDENRKFEFPGHEKCHVAYLFNEGNKIICYVKIFNVFEGFFCVSENLSRYPNFEKKIMFLNYKERTYEEFSGDKLKVDFS